MRPPLRRDRYVAPDMKDWTKVFRYGHLLIFPTTVGPTVRKLFAMDTGLRIKPDFARRGTRSHQCFQPRAGPVQRSQRAR